MNKKILWTLNYSVSSIELNICHQKLYPNPIETDMVFPIPCWIIELEKVFKRIWGFPTEKNTNLFLIFRRVLPWSPWLMCTNTLTKCPSSVWWCLKSNWSTRKIKTTWKSSLTYCRASNESWTSWTNHRFGRFSGKFGTHFPTPLSFQIIDEVLPLLYETKLSDPDVMLRVVRKFPYLVHPSSPICRCSAHMLAKLIY